jgi:hypothetical protein
LLLLASGSLDPVGPGGWSWTSWLGLFLYLGLFVLALRGIAHLAHAPAREDREEEA